MSGDVEVLYAIKDLASPWIPPDNAEPFVHSSINYCDEMDTHNKVLDYDASVTGTPGETADTPLANIAAHDFDTKWQAQAATPEDSQYFELELSEAVDVDSYIMNFHVPHDYVTAPYLPDMCCWKSWKLSGKLNAGDGWTTLETVAANTLKFYRGTFTKGNYKYFRVAGISAYSDQAQTVRIDAYLYTMGLYNSAYKYIDRFPCPCRCRNDVNSNPESAGFTNHSIYITKMITLGAAVYDLNGEMRKAVRGEVIRKYRHIGGIKMEFGEDIHSVDRVNAVKFTRLNSIDFVANADICLYMFPPPDEIWWFLNSAYAFDETTDNMNTPIILKSPDNAHKLTPILTTTRTYSAFSGLGARYVRTMSGEFKVGKNYIVFSDPVNMESQIRFDGQEGRGLIADMNGTALTGCTNASSNVNIARLKIGDIWRGRYGTLTFNPPIVLDGDDASHLFEMRKNEKVKGSMFRYTLYGFKVPKT